jgi:cysteinyl-tRNA synthetase
MGAAPRSVSAGFRATAMDERVRHASSRRRAGKTDVDAMIARRHAARKAKDFKEADRIRDELAALGIELKDAKDPTTGELVTTWEVAR